VHQRITVGDGVTDLLGHPASVGDRWVDGVGRDAEGASSMAAESV
jgi:hypothetical protein